MAQTTYGFVGLGNMGAPFAANILGAGHELAVFDAAGTAERAPEGAWIADSIADLAGQAETIFLSVPDGAASLDVASAIVAAPGRAAAEVIDLSTTGIEAARAVGARLAEAGIAYADAPVSGGRHGAVAGTVTLIWGGPADMIERHRPVLEAISGNIFHVGDAPGQGQAMKLLNNFLSATALAATSEAVAFGLAQGLDLETMLAVVNVSSGQNTASSDKFPRQVVTGQFAAGFHTALMTKDVKLYMAAARDAGLALEVGEVMERLWTGCDDALPGSDFTRIYSFVSARAAANDG